MCETDIWGKQVFRKMIIHIYTCDFVFICRFQNASRFCKLSVVQPCVTVSSARIENYRSSTTLKFRVICIYINCSPLLSILICHLSITSTNFFMNLWAVIAKNFCLHFTSCRDNCFFIRIQLKFHLQLGKQN